MFREMRRKKQALAEEDCVRVLETAPRGFLAMHGENGYPYVVPIDFWYNNHHLYFHSARAGEKIDLLKADPAVTFCALSEGKILEGDWGPTFRSVLVYGRIRLISDADEAEMYLRRLACKYFPSAEEAEKDVQKYKATVQMLDLAIACMSGKTVREQ